MSLRDELLGTAAPAPIGYTLLVPPDWGRFVADDTGRDQLTELMRSRFLEVHRPDLFGQARAAVHRQWEQLRQRGAIEIYMPIIAPVEGGTPMSIVTVPWLAQGEFVEDVVRRADGAEVETLDAGDGSSVYRWQSDREGRAETEGVLSREICYVRPFPGAGPRKGILVMASIVHPGVDEAGPALDGFTALADAVASTLVWRYE
ncbi:hypothetical protein FVO59_07510 [Microbacterium esteraromaticum]|uniref:Uncharacterized protein n=1 Tax=Microbacterium esteraromaticum TaxID=57043 RepID=A0A7D8AJM6_9MICO|nr:hypothetical protein [Microbacterium esteraromaticum]QMU97089.1 hypothetical protein FVO59_07510 [Microbacterium esteraromaticum]